MTLAFFVLIQYRSVTDGQTDRQTDIPPLAIPALSIARYVNALIKSARLLITFRSTKSGRFLWKNNNGDFKSFEGLLLIEGTKVWMWAWHVCYIQPIGDLRGADVGYCKAVLRNCRPVCLSQTQIETRPRTEVRLMSIFRNSNTEH